MIRIVALLANGALLTLFVITAVDRGLPHIDDPEFVLVALVVAAPLLSLLALAKSKPGIFEGNLVAAWYRRKLLEEQAKIKDLEH